MLSKTAAIFLSNLVYAERVASTEAMKAKPVDSHRWTVWFAKMVRMLDEIDALAKSAEHTLNADD